MIGQAKQNLKYTQSQILSAPAKLNLRLKIEGRRADGYHLLSMLNVSLALADELSFSIAPSNSPVVELELEFANEWLAKRDAHLLDQLQDNLVVRAASAFLKEYAPNYALQIKLRKFIPCGSGLAGGSSDAAALLKALAALFHLEQKELLALACELGADLPFFFSAGLAQVSGIGETLTELEWRDELRIPVVLILNAAQIPTQKVFAVERQRGLSYESDHALEAVNSSNLKEHLPMLLSNDLTYAAQSLCAALQELSSDLDRIPGVLYCMSGSGSTLFALSPDLAAFQPQILETLCALEKQHACKVIETQFSPISSYKSAITLFQK